jgi:hypothetical protein
MKNRKLLFVCIVTIFSIVGSSVFAASLEKSDTLQAAPAASSVGNVPGADSGKIAPQKDKNEKCEKEESNFCFRFTNPGMMMKTITTYVDTMTRRGWGGGGGPMAGIFAVNIQPFEDLANNVKPLRGYHFPFGSLNYKTFFMNGGMGFIGVGNGLRLGGGGMDGVRHFTGKSAANSSTINYKTEISWGGFLIEKLVERQNFALTIGGYIGSGSLKADWVEVNENYSAFSDFNDNSDYGDSAKIKAIFGYFEMHAGIVYHVMRFMHIGGDLSLPVIVSSDGFAPFTKEFISICPGVRLRLIFGNLG